MQNVYVCGGKEGECMCGEWGRKGEGGILSKYSFWFSKIFHKGTNVVKSFNGVSSVSYTHHPLAMGILLKRLIVVR